MSFDVITGDASDGEPTRRGSREDARAQRTRSEMIETIGNRHMSARSASEIRSRRIERAVELDIVNFGARTRASSRARLPSSRELLFYFDVAHIRAFKNARGNIVLRERTCASSADVSLHVDV